MRNRRDITRQTAEGIVRCCKACGQWLPQQREHFYQVAEDSESHNRGQWSTLCRPCEQERRKAAYRNGGTTTAKHRKTQTTAKRKAYGSARPTWDFANEAANDLAKALQCVPTAR